MHNGALKRLALALTFWLALHTSVVRAQIFTAPLQASTTGTNPVDFEFRTDGTLLAKGNDGVGSLGTYGLNPGTYMLWYPALSAFRAGYAVTALGQSSIGHYSTSFGYNTSASGTSSFAAGASASASGYASISEGSDSSAPGNFSVALGQGTSATGLNSVSIGVGSVASEYSSVALGGYSTASGHFSTVIGGLMSSASGNYATASGQYSTASSYNSFVIGVANVGGGSATTWVPTDPLFEVGNGTQSGYGNPNATGRSDAFVVYKNGNAILQGTLKVAPGGDIPMYTGN